MTNILIVSSNSAADAELVSAANAIGGAQFGVTINSDAAAQRLAGLGVPVTAIDEPEIISADVAGIASAIGQVAEKVGADVVLLFSDHAGRELSGRLAQRLGAGCVTDAKSLVRDGEQIQLQTNAYNGATIATKEITADRQVIAMAGKAFPPAEPASGGSVTALSGLGISPRVRLVSSEPVAGDAVDIEQANVIVAVGQGMDDQSKLATAQQLATALGGEVACSKPFATDRGWLPEDRIIGISGKSVKPDLAVLLGISGQVQFTVGVRDAKTIVAINNDENAPIMGMADYIVVQDINEALPAFVSALN